MVVICVVPAGISPWLVKPAVFLVRLVNTMKEQEIFPLHVHCVPQEDGLPLEQLLVCIVQVEVALFL